MMTGILGVFMWLMMGLMLLSLAAGSIAWARRRVRGQPARPARQRGQAADGNQHRNPGDTEPRNPADAG
jgi:hypothetical protein